MHHTKTCTPIQSCVLIVVVCRPVESHSGAQGNIFAGSSKHVRVAPLGRNFLNFSFQNSAFWCIFVLLSDGAPPKKNVAGPGVAYPPYPTLSTGLVV